MTTALRDRSGSWVAGQVQAIGHARCLETAATTGLLGLAAYVALIGAVTVTAARALSSLSGIERAVLVTALASFVAYLAEATVSVDVVPLAFAG